MAVGFILETSSLRRLWLMATSYDVQICFAQCKSGFSVLCSQVCSSASTRFTWKIIMTIYWSQRMGVLPSPWPVSLALNSLQPSTLVSMATLGLSCVSFQTFQYPMKDSTSHSLVRKQRIKDHFRKPWAMTLMKLLTWHKVEKQRKYYLSASLEHLEGCLLSHIAGH